MLRAAIFAATVLAAGCPSPRQPVSARPDDDAPLRRRIAHAEARRGAAVPELIELATTGEVRARTLALRGLGRIDDSRVAATLEAALTDREPAVVAAAATAVGVHAALHEPADWFVSDRLLAALPRSTGDARLAIIEALGRAGDVTVQITLARCTREPATAAACALALGRHGRRKLSLTGDARSALVAASASTEPAVRQAATYALAREHAPPTGDDQGASAALAARIPDAVPEIRATAIAGLARRKVVPTARASIEESLRDRDWRVAVEAVRALAAADDAGRVAVASALQRRWAELVAGTPTEVHVIAEGLRALASQPLTERTQIDAVTSLAAVAATDTKAAILSRGWIVCLAHLAARTPEVVAQVASCPLPDHLRLPLLGELVSSPATDAATRRAALRVLLGHEDPRVRAAGLGVLPATWQDADDRGRQTIVTTLTSALASRNAIVAGTAVEATSALLERADPAPLDTVARTALESAITRRARTELDVELAASLLGAIGKHQLATGAEACRLALAGHPVRAKAARACLVELGEPQPAAASEVTALAAPPANVAEVIGHRVTWTLETSRGPISIELLPEVAPWAVASIVALTRRGFYDGLELHRVVPGFVAQGGDPTMSGWGGPGYQLPAEPSGARDGAGFMVGGVGMADAGPDSAGSQWFVMHAPAPHLDGRYTWIGRITEGRNSADALVIGDRVERATISIQPASAVPAK